MSPLSRNPRDATIQFRDIQRWGRCRGLLRGRPDGRHVHRPSLDRWLALTGISFASVLLCPPFRGPGGPLRGYGLIRSRRPEQSLASCPRSRGLRGYGLVRSRRPEQSLASCPGGRGLRGYDLVWSRRPERARRAASWPPPRWPASYRCDASTERTRQPIAGFCRPAARLPPPVPTARVPSLPW